jgi:WD40 repeat protein
MRQFPACSVSFSRDGKYFVTRGGYGTKYEVRTTVYETLTGEKVRTFVMPDNGAGPAGGYSGVAVFSPDGQYVLTGGADGILRLMDIGTGRVARTFEGHGASQYGGINSISFSPDGNRFLSSGYYDDYVILWDFRTGKALRRITGFRGMFGRHVLSVGFSPDGKTAAFLVMLTVKLFDTTSWQEIPVALDFEAEIKITQAVDPAQVVFSPDGNRIFVNTGDAATRIFDTATGDQIAVMVGFDNGEWVFITSEGYYNTSVNGARDLRVSVGNNEYDVEKFYDVFYRPDIVMAKLKKEDINGLVTITMEDAIKEPPPFVTFTAVPEKTDQSKIKVCYEVKDTGGGVGELRLFHNGKLIYSDGYYKELATSSSDKIQLADVNSRAIYEDLRGISLEGRKNPALPPSRPKGSLYKDCREIETVPGENEVSVSAFNRNNTVQSPVKSATFRSTVTPETPRLYILSIGIDQYKDATVNLKYAAKDAKEIEEKLRAQASTLYRPQNIHCALLTNRQATKTNIVRKIDEFAKLVKPQDGFILFVAGHGVLMQNQYYMITHDYSGTANQDSMISSNEIVEISKTIKSLSQLLIFDTCHAGGVDYIISGLYDARMSVLAKKMGLHIYASSSDKQSAIDGFKGNGLFSYTLLDALDNNKRADTNSDGRVGLVELGSYSKRATTDISQGLGHKQTPVIINFGKDTPLYRLK